VLPKLWQQLNSHADSSPDQPDADDVIDEVPVVASQPRLEGTLGFRGAVFEVLQPRVSLCHRVAASCWVWSRCSAAVTISLPTTWKPPMGRRLFRRQRHGWSRVFSLQRSRRVAPASVRSRRVATGGWDVVWERVEPIARITPTDDEPLAADDLEAVLGEVLVIRERLPDTEPPHDLEAAAIDQAQAPAVGRQKGADGRGVILLQHPVHRDNG